MYKRNSGLGSHPSGFAAGASEDILSVLFELTVLLGPLAQENKHNGTNRYY